MSIADAIVVLEDQLRIVAYQDAAYARNDLVSPELKRSVHAHHEALLVAIPILKQELARLYAQAADPDQWLATFSAMPSTPPRPDDREE